MVEGHPPNGLGVVCEGRRTASLRQGKQWEFLQHLVPQTRKYQNLKYTSYFGQSSGRSCASAVPGQALQSRTFAGYPSSACLMIHSKSWRMIRKTNLQEIPDLNGVVARARAQHGPMRVEGHTRHPIPMTLTTHEEVAIRHGPDLPCLVVAHRGNYRLRPIENANSLVGDSRTFITFLYILSMQHSHCIWQRRVKRGCSRACRVMGRSTKEMEYTYKLTQTQISGTNLARVEGYGGDGVEVAFEAFPQSKPLHGRRLEREVQEWIFHLQRNQRGFNMMIKL